MAAISVTAANVLPGSNSNIQVGTAGATITQGQSLYFDSASGTLKLADADGTSPANTFSGIALNAGSTGQPISYTAQASALVPGGTVLAGDVIYLSPVAGGITKTYADLTSGATVIILGVVNTDLSLNLKSVVGGVKA